MFSYFPQVRDEESTYSIFARMQFALNPPNFEFMGNMLFGRKFEVGRLNFQGSFDYLCNQLPSTYTPEKFLHTNTIYPLYIPFISEEKHTRAVQYFKGDYPDKIQKCLKISEITKTRTYIRVCKECVREDSILYGEPYYRRQHEIELNRMCNKHRVPLYEYEIFPYKLPCRYNDFYTVLSNAKPINIPYKFRDKFLEITDAINFIFLNNFEGWNIEKTRKRISSKMIENGYVTANNVTLQKKLCEDFKSYYSEEFLKYIGFNFDINENDSWIRHCTTRKKLIADPLKFILIIIFLFNNFKIFYEYTEEYRLFKPGPYPCLNVVCPNYKKLIIKNAMQINISHTYPLATFKCDYCGFTYSRRGPDKDDTDIFKKTYVKDYGHLWLEGLKKYSKQRLSLRKMSKLLGCNSVETIKRYTEKAKLNEVILTNSNQEPKSSITDDLLLVEKYKSMFLQILCKNPKMNALLIFRKYQNAYKLVCKYDRDWVNNNLIKKEEPKISNNDRLQKYWKEKDDLLYQKILKTIYKIKSKQELHERITIDLLQKYIGYYNLHQNKNKLPKCFEIINLECETIPDYQKRRADYVMKQMAYNSKKITFAKVLYSAGLRDRANEEVVNYIKEKIKEHNQGKIVK